MEVLKDNFNKKSIEDLRNHTCRWCESLLKYSSEDIVRGNITLSQTEEYYNIEGIICGACGRFDNLKNGY